MTIDLSVNLGENLGKLEKFWQAAGCDYLYESTLSPAGQFLLDRCEKDGTMSFLRNHYALSDHRDREGKRMGGEVLKRNADGAYEYDFSYITSVYAEWVKRGIRPVVEMDFMPDALIDMEFTPERHVHNAAPNDLQAWADLVTAFVTHMQKTFGIEETRKWYWEFWNEPDWWWRDNLPTYLKMYDTFVACVESVDPQLRVGGPSAFTSFIEHFLQHCAHGTNYVTGKKGSRLDFLSYHSYATPGCSDTLYPLFKPRLETILYDVLDLHYLLKKYPQFKDIEFHLNEWGVSAHFEETVKSYPHLEFRNTEYSALFMLRLVDSLLALGDHTGLYPKMLLYWGFAYEADGDCFAGNRSLLTRGNVLKPVYAAYVLLHKLREHRVRLLGAKAGDIVHGIASADKGGATVLLYNFDEDPGKDASPADIRLELAGLPETVDCVKMRKLPFGKWQNNSYRAWESLGRPSEPDESSIMQMRNSFSSSIEGEIVLQVKAGKLSVDICLPGESAAIYDFDFRVIP
jgi:xylan 1,4-beta-xylosidase